MSSVDEPAPRSAAGQELEGVPDAHHATLRALRASSLLRAQRRELMEFDDEEEIYRAACRFAVEVGQFRFAWIGLPDHDNGLIRPHVWFGEGETYLDALRVAMCSGPEADGPTGIAYRTHTIAVVSDIATDPRMEPWRERALAHGFRASAAFPFRREEGGGGTLNVYSNEPGFDAPIELSLLEGVAEDIGYALDLAQQRRARQRAEAALIESERRHRAIFEQASDGIFVANAEQRYIDVNPAGLALLGYTREELLGLHLRDLIPAEDLVVQPLQPQRFTAGQPFVVDRRLKRKDGRVVEVEISGVRLPDGTLQSVVRDVSERKRLLAERAATERVASLGRLAQGVGHEINNPLAYLVLSLDLLRAELDELPTGVSQEALEVLGHIEDAASRIAAIVRSLARFGRGDAETVGPTDLERSIRAAIAMTANRLNHVADLRLSLAATPFVRGNEFQLTQVFVNLLLNAADAITEVAGGPHTVTVTTRIVDGLVEVDVADSGPGIPESIRTHVFEPHVTTKPIGRGSGLGLSICKSILESFGGSIGLVDSGVGATFRITLALSEVSEAPRDPPVQTSRPRLSLLVIDDEPIILRVIKTLLRDHEVVTVMTPSDALEACRGRDFDRILCDVMFPGGSVEPFYDTLALERPELAHRIIFMTGGAFTPSSQTFLERTGRPWLAKPFTGPELNRILAEQPP